MKYTIREIRNSSEAIVEVDQIISIQNELIDRQINLEIQKEPRLKGYFTYDNHEVTLHGQIDVTLILPSSLSLKPVVYDLTIPVSERYVEAQYDGNIDDYAETTIVITDDTIDLVDLVTDLILINIPTKVYGPDEDEAHLPHGKDWEVITEANYIEQQSERRLQSEDSPFAALQQLLNDQERSDS